MFESSQLAGGCSISSMRLVFNFVEYHAGVQMILVNQKLIRARDVDDVWSVCSAGKCFTLWVTIACA